MNISDFFLPDYHIFKSCPFDTDLLAGLYGSFLWFFFFIDKLSLVVTHMVSAYQSTLFDLSSKNCMLK